MMLTDEQVAEIVETTYPCEWETDYDPCNPTCALCLKRSTCALLTDRAALEAENERLRHDAEQWRKHEYGVARACEQGTADLARLAALDEEVGE